MVSISHFNVLFRCIVFRFVVFFRSPVVFSFSVLNSLKAVSFNEIITMRPEDEERLQEATELTMRKALMASSSADVPLNIAESVSNFHPLKTESDLTSDELRTFTDAESDDDFDEEFDDPEFEYAENPTDRQ